MKEAKTFGILGFQGSTLSSKKSIYMMSWSLGVETEVQRIYNFLLFFPFVHDRTNIFQFIEVVAKCFIDHSSSRFILGDKR